MMSEVTAHFGPRTLRHQDISALVRGHFGTTAERQWHSAPVATWQLKDTISPKSLHQKLQHRGYRVALCTQYQRVTDRWTDTHYSGIRRVLHDAADVQNTRWIGGGAVDMHAVNVDGLAWRRHGSNHWLIALDGQDSSALGARLFCT